MTVNVRLAAATAALVAAGAGGPLAALAPVASASVPLTAVPLTAGPPAAGRPAAEPAAAERAGPPLSIVRYWTAARMRAARPNGPGRAPAAGNTEAPWPGGGPVARAVGKVFFTLDGTDYVCSGSAVASTGADVAITAGHCVSDGAGHPATNWMFVPGYTDGTAPYGRYSARRVFAPRQWTSGAADNEDFAFVTIKPAPATAGAGDPMRAAGGGWGLGIAFGRHPAREAVFGYPAASPYRGQQLDYCEGATHPDPYHATSDSGVDCQLTEGASGGPWLSGFDASAGTGTITSVSSFKYSDGSPVMYGPVLGPGAKSLYQQAEHA